MITLRPLPPAARDHPDALLHVYYAGLLAAWGRSARATGALISRVLAGKDAHGIEPGEWRLIRGRIAPAHYVSMRARKGIHRLLNPAALPLGASILKDKRRFHGFAAAHDLTTPECCFDASAAATWLGNQQRILIKPNFSSKGKGIALFARKDAGWQSDGGTSFDPGAMAAHLRSALQRGAIAQSAIATLPALAPISPGALPTLRIVTIMDDAGHPQALSWVLRLGGGAAPVDNFNRGGIAVALDAEGHLGAKVRSAAGGLLDITAHPVGGASFPDRLPGALMASAGDLARAAHRALGPGHAVVGWDIGLGDAGPVLIEGNWNPGTDVMQLLDRHPLSAQPAGGLYIAALARVPEARWATAAPVQWDGR